MTRRQSCSIRLNYPPSVNNYWRHVGSRTYISPAGRAYRDHAAGYLTDVRFGTARIALQLEVIPPDNRRRDLDNVAKAILDALQHAGIYDDDSQIDHLMLIRLPVEPPGAIDVTITEL